MQFYTHAWGTFVGCLHLYLGVCRHYGWGNQFNIINYQLGIPVVQINVYVKALIENYFFLNRYHIFSFTHMRIFGLM